VLVKRDVDEALSMRTVVEEEVSCIAIAATLFFSFSLSSSLSLFDCHSWPRCASPLFLSLYFLSPYLIYLDFFPLLGQSAARWPVSPHS
jgi:hypothetical protein